VATPPTDAGTGRGFRDRPLGRIAILVVVLVVALLVARTCGSTQPDVSSEQAIEIAREEVGFAGPGVQIRNVPRGFERRMWVVDLYTGPARNPGRCRQVEIDADRGDVLAVRAC
jgi:hypothetical protein